MNVDFCLIDIYRTNLALLVKAVSNTHISRPMYLDGTLAYYRIQDNNKILQSAFSLL